MKYAKKWPHCDNAGGCLSGNLEKFTKACDALGSGCDGFSFNGKNGGNGNGCLKKQCKPAQEGRKGFGKGSHGYWVKGASNSAANTKQACKHANGQFINFSNGLALDVSGGVDDEARKV
jgi:hypothetical protein